MGINVDVFGLRGLLLLLQVVRGEVGRRRVHHTWRWVHLRPQWRRAVHHVRRYEGLQRLLDNRAPVFLEGSRSSGAERVVGVLVVRGLVVVVLLLLHLRMMEVVRKWHLRGWLQVKKKRRRS